jgi:hypothetical protein
MPEAKVRQYDSSKQSLKFQVMVAITEKDKTWSESQIRKHCEDMLVLLVADVASQQPQRTSISQSIARAYGV